MIESAPPSQLSPSSGHPAPEGLVFRNWRASDVPALCRHANNHNLWINLLDRFPHPYSRRDAKRWIALNNATLSAAVNFAIELDGEAIGGVGLDRKQDVYRGTAEVGYWVAEPFWGRGIATAAVRFITGYAFSALPIVRLEARVFEWNAASARVLEKAGFRREARLRKAVTKDDRLGDALLYALCRDELPPAPPAT